MYSIGEFSKISGLTIKTLRFYHERGLLIPAQVDEDSGYRYYDRENMERARVIRQLRALEFAVDDIATMLSECEEDQDLLAYLQEHRSWLLEKQRHYRNLSKQLDGIIAIERTTREALTMSDYEIIEKDVAPLKIAGQRMTGRYSDCGPAFAALGKKFGRYIAGKPLCLHYDGEYREDDANFEACFPVRDSVKADDAVRTLPAQRCVTLIHRGPYDTLGNSYARLLDYMKAQGYEIDLPTREIYLKGPGMLFKGNPKKYLTEIQLPIRS